MSFLIDPPWLYTGGQAYARLAPRSEDPTTARALGTATVAAFWLTSVSIYLNRRDLPRALSCVDRLLLLAPNDARVLRDRAKLYEMLGGAQAAAVDLERVLSLDPNASDASTLRARLSRLRGSPPLLN